MPDGASSMVVEEESDVGDVEESAVEQELHLDIVDGKIVFRRNGCGPVENTTLLSDGDIVEIKNVPEFVRDHYGLTNEIRARYHGDPRCPGFRVSRNGIFGRRVISFDFLTQFGDFRNVVINIKRFCVKSQSIRG